MLDLSKCIEQILIKKQIADSIAIINERFGISYPTLTDEQKAKIKI